MNRRQFLQQSTAALGAAACAPLLQPMALVNVTRVWAYDPIQDFWWTYDTIKLTPEWVAEAANYPIVYSGE